MRPNADAVGRMLDDFFHYTLKEDTLREARAILEAVRARA